MTHPLETLASHHTCYYCKLAHRKVEAGGLHHCPNVLCLGPGAAYWRSKLSSYRDVRGTNSHTVDDEEAVVKGLAHAYDLAATEPEIAAAIRASAAKWRTTAAPPREDR